MNTYDLKDAKLAKLQEFKDYVHERLDQMGVPVDPEPEKNAKTGCRIEGRLNHVEKILKNLKELKDIVQNNPGRFGKDLGPLLRKNDLERHNETDCGS